MTPTAGYGVALSNVKTSGYDTRFTVTNSGVTQLIAGTGILVSSNVGNITISASGTNTINVFGTTSSYTATANDEYIGVNNTAATTITLPAGVAGRVYTIKDEHGAGMGKITVQPQPSELIDGKVNYTIGAAYQGVNIVFRANGWWII